MSTVAERVARGTALLDEKNPGWDQRISPDTLDIGSGCDCVLAQAFGGYPKGVIALGLATGPLDRADFGFFWYGEDDVQDDADIEALTAEWRRVIEARRAATS